MYITLEFRDYETNAYIKQWPNWYGAPPVIGDLVILHWDDVIEDKRFVKGRIISGTEPDKIIILL